MRATDTLHATAVAFGRSGLIITGASGAGKSTLALQLIGLGATLIADDGVLAMPRDGEVWLCAPDAIQGRIEARGIGVLACPAKPAWARAVVTLDEVETARFPEARETVIAGVRLPLLRKVESPAFPAMLRLYLEGGRDSNDG